MQKPVNDQYFEAVIQVRPMDKEVVEYVRKLVEKRSNVFISKIVCAKFGCDLYLSDRKYAMAIGKKLKGRFGGGELKVSRSLYGYDRQSSKEKYRVVVCFRLERNL